jgi:hypothetical protein
MSRLSNYLVLVLGELRPLDSFPAGVLGCEFYFASAKGATLLIVVIPLLLDLFFPASIVLLDLDRHPDLLAVDWDASGSRYADANLPITAYLNDGKLDVITKHNGLILVPRKYEHGRPPVYCCFS